jgi:hypothetical protein
MGVSSFSNAQELAEQIAMNERPQYSEVADGFEVSINTALKDGFQEAAIEEGFGTAEEEASFTKDRDMPTREDFVVLKFKNVGDGKAFKKFCRFWNT